MPKAGVGMIGMNNSSSNNVVNRMLCRVDHTGRLLQSTDSRRAGRARLVIPSRV